MHRCAYGACARVALVQLVEQEGDHVCDEQGASRVCLGPELDELNTPHAKVHHLRLVVQRRSLDLAGRNKTFFKLSQVLTVSLREGNAPWRQPTYRPKNTTMIIRSATLLLLSFLALSPIPAILALPCNFIRDLLIPIIVLRIFVRHRFFATVCGFLARQLIKHILLVVRGLRTFHAPRPCHFQNLAEACCAHLSNNGPEGSDRNITQGV
mmetsp:Transcript_51978/g.126810  ORF Transcript_51978/g.126810 Transcript_51978/m.126810 type:complete len:210 (-) Transcript_51978:1679-2308(-)